MARTNESTNAHEPALPDQQGWRHWGDGLAGKLFGARMQGFYPTAADYRDVQVDVNGVVQVSSSGSTGGGAATIADGADVAQGATTDVAWVSGAGTLIAISKAEFAKLEAIRALLAGSLTVNVGLTDTQLRASAVPVSGSFFQATQPVSLATNTPDVTDRAARLLGHVTVDSAPTTAITAAALPLPSGAATAALQTTISGQLPATLGSKVSASSLPIVIASDQAAVPTYKVTGGQTTVMKTGAITSTAVTADQVVLTYTVTALKTFYLCYLTMYGRLTAISATASILGAISLETPSGTKVITLDDNNPTTSEVEFNPITFSEPIPIAAGVVVRVVVTPAATTSMLWRANFGGYEK